MSTVDCDATTRAGRLTKARQFARSARDALDLADEARDVADAFVTLAVHAGIAASDVICCTRLGVHHRGERHQDAVALLKKADPDAARALAVLLSLKTLAGYAAATVSTKDLLRAERAMAALLDAANAVS